MQSYEKERPCSRRASFKLAHRHHPKALVCPSNNNTKRVHLSTTEMMPSLPYANKWRLTSVPRLQNIDRQSHVERNEEQLLDPSTISHSRYLPAPGLRLQRLRHVTSALPNIVHPDPRIRYQTAGSQTAFVKTARLRSQSSRTLEQAQHSGNNQLLHPVTSKRLGTLPPSYNRVPSKVSSGSRV